MQCTTGLFPESRLSRSISCAVLLLAAVLLACGGGGSNSNGSAPPPTTTQATSSTFGMHINRLTTPWPQDKFAAIRLWDTNTGWAQINSAPGVYDWSRMDSWLSLAQTHGVDVLYVLARTPVWAQCGNTDPSCGSGVPKTCAYASEPNGGGPGQCYPPNDLGADGSGADAIWKSWVTAVATHSANSSSAHIKYYEIWNEPTSAAMWQGTTPQLVRMTQDAKVIIAGIDPNARVLTPSPVAQPPFNDLFGFMNNFLTQGGGASADVIAFHGYVHTRTCCPEPERIVNLLSGLRSVLAANGQAGKPLFNTEGGWGRTDFDGFTDPEQQAAFAARYILLQISAGISRFYWYQWENPNSGTLWTGSGLTAAGVAYQQVENWVAGATPVGPCAQSGTVWTCSYSRPGGYQATAVWDTSQSCSGSDCTTSSFTASAAFKQYLDIAGNSHTANGTVPIGAKPILLQTGPLPTS
jgi:polysaccharide biosynthesis protein PslG